jgi:DNA-binding protein YbaB
MISFSKAKDLFRMQREAKRVKKQLRNIHVEAEAEGVKVVLNAEQEVLEIAIAEHVARERLPLLLRDALNRALKKAQVVAAEHMQGIMGEMGLGVEG